MKLKAFSHGSEQEAGRRADQVRSEEWQGQQTFRKEELRTFRSW